MSRIIEVDKFFDRNLIYEFHIETLSYNINGKKIETNKWLKYLDWIEIYNKLNEYINDSDKLMNLKNNETFRLPNNLEIFINIIPLENYYIKLLNLKKCDTIDQLLKITIRKVKIENYENEIEELKKRLNNNKEEKCDNNNKHENSICEYDPVKAGNGIQNDLNIVPYKPSKVSDKKDNDAEISNVENNPYSPKPIELSSRITEYDDTINFEECIENEINTEMFQSLNSSITKTEKDKEIGTIDDMEKEYKFDKRRLRTKYKMPSLSPEIKKRILSPDHRRAGSSSSSIGCSKTVSERRSKRKKYEEKNTNGEKLRLSEDLFGSDDSNQGEHDKKIKEKSTRKNKNDTKDYVRKSSRSTEKKSAKKLNNEKSNLKQSGVSKWISKSKSGTNKKSSSSSSSSSSSITKGRKSSSKLEKIAEKSENKVEMDEKIQQKSPIKEHKEETNDFMKENPQIMSDSYNDENITQLNLRHLSLDDFINTFEEMKPALDKAFEEGKKEKRITYTRMIPTKQCLAINELIDESVHMPSLLYLRDHYVEDLSCSDTARIMTDIMIQEWILNVFMKIYNFNREEAIKRINFQFENDSKNPEVIAELEYEYFLGKKMERENRKRLKR